MKTVLVLVAMVVCSDVQATGKKAFVFDQEVAVVQAPVVAPPSPSFRAPVGHTHTCANGHTWDHSVTPGHNCPVCGLQQYIQDRVPRPVTSYRSIAPTYSYRQPGCVGGNCPTIIIQR